ncbi:MAG: hypothetical protein GEV05_21180 [Betaproteobacteria bacterium]|nr:hypothetical protein [Betaproteobacteria bacterium]
MSEPDAPNPQPALPQRRRIVLGAAILLGGCAEPYRGPGTETPGPQRVARLDVQGRVEVLQGGRVVVARDGMPLFAGDEIRTLASSYAQCRFVDGARVWLDYDTRVRMGSVFTFFGRVFASVSGIFQVDSEFVAASSEGTEYTVTIGRGNTEFSVAVRNGTVLCQPRQGRWRPVRLIAGQRLVGRGMATPRADRLDSGEYETEFGWVPAVRTTPQFKFRQPAPARESTPPRRTPPQSTPQPTPPATTPPRSTTPPATTPPTPPSQSAPVQQSPRSRGGLIERIERPTSPAPNDPR